LLAQGVELMLVGMGTVFVFLTILVLVTSFMSRLVVRYLPEPTVVTATGAGTPIAGDELIAVIAAAIRAHRSRSSSER
jgi:oxaloacetate decarboxylase gamma subunit